MRGHVVSSFSSSLASTSDAKMNFTDGHLQAFLGQGGQSLILLFTKCNKVRRLSDVTCICISDVSTIYISNSNLSETQLSPAFQKWLGIKGPSFSLKPSFRFLLLLNR